MRILLIKKIEVQGGDGEKIIFQLFSEQAERFFDVVFHRIDGNVQLIGYFGIALVAIPAQEEYSFALLGHRLDDFLYLLFQFR